MSERSSVIDEAVAGEKDRFDAKWLGEPNSGCWLWMAGGKGHGYGSFYASSQRKSEAASRAAYRLYRGPIPNGIFVCHKCDTPACVRPDHLFLGTHSENMKDSAAKGRHWLKRHPEKSLLFKHRVVRTGEDHYMSVLSNADVRRLRELRAEGLSYSDIGKIMGVSSFSAGMIARGTSRLGAGGPIAPRVHGKFSRLTQQEGK